VADLLITNDNKSDVHVLVEELHQLQRWVAAPMVEQKGNGVGEDFAQSSLLARCHRSRAHTRFTE
jgi:hypothetical protein